MRYFILSLSLSFYFFLTAREVVLDNGSTITFSDEHTNDDLEAVEKLEYIDPALCKKVLTAAPLQIQEIVFALAQRPDLKNIIPQKMLLVGPPGVGKTTLAVAIAQVTERECCMVRAPFVADQYKNSGAKNLESIFQSIIEKPHPCVLIIDEINCLTDHHNNPHNTDSNMAEALWIALDICKLNPHIFVVATTNDPSKMPVQLKNRFEGCTVEMPLKDTYEQRLDIIKFYFEKWPCTIDKTVATYCAKKTKTFSARQLEELVRQAVLSAALCTKEQPEIKKSDIEKALKHFTDSHKLLFPLLTSDYKQYLWYCFKGLNLAYLPSYLLFKIFKAYQQSGSKVENAGD